MSGSSPAALCLSGGGFRATLFHLGVVRRANELGVLSTLDAITSVSGGSILNGFLASGWARLTARNGVFTNFDAEVAAPVEAFCGHDLRTPLLFGTRLNPARLGALFRDGFSVRANFLAAAYRPALPSRLRELPAPGPGVPRFVFVATNVTTGLSWQFHAGSAARMGDFHFGYRPVGDTGLAEAVAASSAFPPGFSALRLTVPPAAADERIDPWGQHRPPSDRRGGQAHAHRSGQVLLTDGGVYDNLGLEPVLNRTAAGVQPGWSPNCYSLLVSNAQQLFQSDPTAAQWLLPRILRANDIMFEQVGALRRRWLIERAAAAAGGWRGVIWMLSSNPADYAAHHPGYSDAVRDRLIRVRTDLNTFNADEQAILQNMGYWVADAALRTHGRPPLPQADFAWPYPDHVSDTIALPALAESHSRRLFRDLLRYCRTGGNRTPSVPRRK